jgi:hypothetical protein
MQFNPKALLVLFGFLGLIMLGVSSRHGALFYATEVVVSILIVWGITEYGVAGRADRSS